MLLYVVCDDDLLSTSDEGITNMVLNSFFPSSKKEFIVTDMSEGTHFPALISFRPLNFNFRNFSRGEFFRTDPDSPNETLTMRNIQTHKHK